MKKRNQMADVQELKRQAAEAAVEYVESGMVVGLGTGSTAVFAVRKLGQLLANGRLSNIVAIPTSEETAREAESLHIPLVTLDDIPEIDITIDGADEITPTLDLIKGLGGALLREKIVATATKTLIIVGDGSKRVARLGTQAPVPVEVIPFARRPVSEYLTRLGGQVTVRLDNAGKRPFRTDENNLILDCRFVGGLDDPAATAQAIRQQPGVVEHGLFLNMAALAIVASPTELVTLER